MTLINDFLNITWHTQSGGARDLGVIFKKLHFKIEKWKIRFSRQYWNFLFPGYFDEEFSRSNKVI